LYWVGKNWDIPDFSDELRARSICRHEECFETESLEHILCHCLAPGQEQVWRFVQALWKEKMPHYELNHPGIEMILSCGIVRFTLPDGKRDYGSERLYRILISESARLIWWIRCRRVIDNKTEPLDEEGIKNHWYAAMNQRLELDRELTNKRKYEKRALKKRDVIQTWSGVLEGEAQLPRDWTRAGGVLVGIRSRLGDEVQGEDEEDD
jgi:hypothetical protein